MKRFAVGYNQASKGLNRIKPLLSHTTKHVQLQPRTQSDVGVVGASFSGTQEHYAEHPGCLPTANTSAHCESNFPQESRLHILQTMMHVRSLASG
jgi:hypothetical protein